jgi:aspartate aminotransferase
MLSFVCDNEGEAAKLKSQVMLNARAMYSNPPLHGARLVETVLADPALNKMWLGEVKGMADRIIDMRAELVKKLGEQGSAHDWSHITN